MKQLALAAIRLYQRHLSPHKGFCCAYRVHTGRASCSNLGFRAIRRLGIWRGLAVLRQRLEKCGIAHRRHRRRSLARRGQAGFCDLPCDIPCDFEAGNAVCDILDNCPPCDCGGDWGAGRKSEEEERQVHLPDSNRQ